MLKNEKKAWSIRTTAEFLIVTMRDRSLWASVLQDPDYHTEKHNPNKVERQIPHDKIIFKEYLNIKPTLVGTGRNKGEVKQA